RDWSSDVCSSDLSGFSLSQYGYIGIRRGFQKSQTTCYDKQGTKEKPEGERFGSRNKQQGACGIQQKPENDPFFISLFFHKKACRNGNQEIPEVEGRLHQQGHGPGNIKQRLKVRDQQIGRAHV